MKALRALLIALPLILPCSAAAEVRLTPVASFDAPIHVSAAPGDGRRLFVVERGGAIRVVRDGRKLDVPFLEIGGVESAGEGGLLSMAFPPDYAASGLFYVFLTPADATPGGAPHAPIEIREYRRSPADPDRADPASARTVLTVPHPDFANHYGGDLHFGPDGLLYASTGDGGGTGDPGGNALDLDSRLGKILRLSPRQAGSAPFTVPADNPFVGAPGDDLVWSYGLRNPFRFSFDRTTGDLTVGDVGQNYSEEIDFVPRTAGGGRGADFGWSDCEGPFDYPIAATPAPCGRSGDTPPVHSYEPASGCRSVTGGVVVRDPGLEELAGRYVYGDFCRQGLLRSLRLATPAATEDADLGVDVPNFNLVAFGEDACGRVHTVELGTGRVSRLEDSSPAACSLTVDHRRPAPAPPSAAAAAVRVRLGGSRRQRVLRRRALLVRVRCDRRCDVRVPGRLRAGARSLRLRGVSRRAVPPGRTVTLRVRIGRRGRTAIRRALRLRRPVRAELTVRVRGSDGRLVTARRTIRIVG